MFRSLRMLCLCYRYCTVFLFAINIDHYHTSLPPLTGRRSNRNDKWLESAVKHRSRNISTLCHTACLAVIPWHARCTNCTGNNSTTISSNGSVTWMNFEDILEHTPRIKVLMFH